MNTPAAALRRTGRSWEPGRSLSDSITLYLEALPHFAHWHFPFAQVQSPGPSHLHFSATCAGFFASGAGAGASFAAASFASWLSFASAGAFTAAAWASHARAGAGITRKSATAPPASHAIIEPVRAIAIPSASLQKLLKSARSYPSSP